MADVLDKEMSTGTLYKLDSKGVTRVWRAWSKLNEDGSATEHNESGIEGGTLSGIPITIRSGKNIGKKNETTPLQQANIKIDSKYVKKLREGYVRDLADFTQQGVMAAHEWKVSKHRMSKLALHQPKLDGIRLKIHRNADNAIVLMSKGNKEFKTFLYDTTWANHINHTLPVGESTDGEMYIHGLELNEIASLVMSYKYNQEELMEYCTDTKDGLRIDLNSKQILDLVYVGNFQPEAEVQVKENGSFIKTGRLAEGMGAVEIGRNKGWILPGVTKADVQVLGTSDLEYWMFDCPDTTSTADERNANLAEKWDYEDAAAHKIRCLIAEEFDTDDIEEINNIHVANGFEGTMVRLPSGTYAFGERSAVLQKFKLFHDAEWDIVGYELDREGNPTFVFISDAGIEFKARPVGNRAWRAKVLEDMDKLIGEKATIRYQALFQETLCPQFARVIAIRNYE